MYGPYHHSAAKKRMVGQVAENSKTYKDQLTCTRGSPPYSIWRSGRDRIVVSTSRCGRDNPGSNPGHGRVAVNSVMASRMIFYAKVSQGFTLYPKFGTITISHALSLP